MLIKRYKILQTTEKAILGTAMDLFKFSYIAGLVNKLKKLPIKKSNNNAKDE